MDRHNNWQESRDDRRRDERRSDESNYRGAYRLDRDKENYRSEQSRSNEMENRGRYRQNEDQGGDYVYRRSRNLQDNDDYTERRNQQSYRGDSSQRSDRNDFGGRYSSHADRHKNRSDENESRGNSRSGSQQYGDDYSRRTAGNFDGDYRPDNYRRGRDENYGNMAGSLSYGYDGDRNSDPDYNRRYNPLTGELRQRQNDDSRQQQPRRYGPPDRTGSNPDYDRY